MAIWIPRYLNRILERFDASEAWDPDPPTPNEIYEAGCDAACGLWDELTPVVDVTERAATARYRNGKIKRTRFRRVNLRKRKVLIGLHQAGAKRGEKTTAKKAHKYTCHWLIGPTGVRYRVHPLDVRLVAANRMDRSPYHTINIEVGGNFAGTAGNDNTFWRPDIMGRSYLLPPQLQGIRDCLMDICDEVETEYSAVGVVGVFPHRVAGRDGDGRPNRPLCCGSEIWSEAGEWIAWRRRLQVPAPGADFGGTAIPEKWHGPFHRLLQQNGLETLRP